MLERDHAIVVCLCFQMYLFLVKYPAYWLWDPADHHLYIDFIDSYESSFEVFV